MAVLQRYILGELLKVFIFLVSVLTVLLVFVGVFREVSESGLGPAQVFQILPFVVPSLLPFTIPATFLLTVCSVYGRMSGDLEVTAAKAAGINVMSLLMPSLVLACLLSLSSFVLMDRVIPWAVHNIERTITLAMEDIFLDVLRTHHQVTDHKRGFSVTVMDVEGKKTGHSHLSVRSAGKQPITIQAQQATFTFDLKKREVMMHLVRGYIDTPGEERVWFEEIDHPFPLPSETREPKPRNLSIEDIHTRQREITRESVEVHKRRDIETVLNLSLGSFDRFSEPEFLAYKKKQRDHKRHLNRMETEIHSRLAMSLSCFCFVLIGAPYAILRGDTQFLTSFFWCFMPILLLYYPVTMLMMNLGKTGAVNPAWGMWVGNVITLTVGWDAPPSDSTREEPPAGLTRRESAVPPCRIPESRRHGGRTPPVSEVLGNRKSSLREFPQVEHQPGGTIAAGVVKGRENIGRGVSQEGECPPPHPRPGTDSRFAENQHRTGNHIEPERVAGLPRHGDHPSTHGVTNFVTSVAVNQNFPAGHPSASAPVNRPDQMPGVAADGDPTAMHFGSDPVGRVAGDVYFPAGHFRPEMHAGVPLHPHDPFAEVGADQLHLGAVPFPDDCRVIPGRTGNPKHLPQFDLSVAVLNQGAADFLRRLLAESFQADAIHFERNRMLPEQAEC
jgi:lipopolysaccharide export system permease protein